MKTTNQIDDKIISDALAILASRLRAPEVAITSPATTVQYLKLNLAAREHEVFAVLFLDSQHRVIEFKEMFRGTIDGAAVYPREVVKEALALNAAAVIFAHNHPSGVTEPSQADKNITERLKTALALFDIRTLDHMIVGANSITSMAELGWV